MFSCPLRIMALLSTACCQTYRFHYTASAVSNFRRKEATDRNGRLSSPVPKECAVLQDCRHSDRQCGGGVRGLAWRIRRAGEVLCSRSVGIRTDNAEVVFGVSVAHPALRPWRTQRALQKLQREAAAAQRRIHSEKPASLSQVGSRREDIFLRICTWTSDSRWGRCALPALRPRALACTAHEQSMVRDVGLGRPQTSCCSIGNVGWYQSVHGRRCPGLIVSASTWLIDTKRGAAGHSAR